MVDACLPTTCLSLLARLRHVPSNEAAWDEFVEQYGRHIYRWCRYWRLQDADANDVVQDVLLKLARTLSDFAYDPRSSFRGWLKTVAHHAWRDFANAQRRAAAVADDHTWERLQSMEARDDLIQRLEEAFDFELLEAAKARVRVRVAPHTWEAFRLAAVDCVPVAEVAARVRMQIAMVYVAKSKVQKMLREEIRKLEADQ
jgi:RNA polymerase sigma-70 factor (ECF subfamily)